MVEFMQYEVAGFVGFKPYEFLWARIYGESINGWI